MGLFDKKFCAICGGKAGFLALSFKDGKNLCDACWKKLAYNGSINLEIRNKIDTNINEMSVEDYNAFIALREQNLEVLKTFNPTKSYKYIHMDEETGNVLLFPQRDLKNRETLLAKNPPVFNILEIAFMRVVCSDVERDTTITGKATASCDASLVIAVDNPIYTVCKVPLGKGKAKEDFFGNMKDKWDPVIDEVMGTLNGMFHGLELEDKERAALVDDDKLTIGIRMAKEAKFLSRDDVEEILQELCRGDRELIMQIKMMYNL